MVAAAVVETNALVRGPVVLCLILRATAWSPAVTGDRQWPRTCAINDFGREGVAIEGPRPNPWSLTAKAGPSLLRCCGHHRDPCEPEPARSHPPGPSRGSGDPLLDHGTPATARLHVSGVSPDE
jgi:hypothetical protein